MAGLPLKLSLRSPTHAPVDLGASEVSMPGQAGIFTVLPGHTPLLTTLTKGVLVAYGTEDGDRYLSIHDGFTEVLDDHITVLAEVMELAEEIDVERARAAEERAHERLHKRESELDVLRAEAALARSLARTQAHGRQPY